MDSEKTFLKQFILCYRSHPALWDSTSPDYISKSKKIPGYKELRHIFRKFKADATIDDVKKKINSLRCSYRRELKKTLQLDMCGAGIDENYKPTLWWYPLMTFLQKCDTLTEAFYKVDLSCDEMNESFADEQITADDLKTFYEETTVDDEQKTSIDDLISADEHKPTRKRSRTSNASRSLKSPKLFDMESPSFSKQLDTYDYMARTWADKLRNMTNLQRMIAEKGVNDILFEGEMGTLTRDSIQIRLDFASCQSPTE